MFIQGKEPCLVVAKSEANKFHRDLIATGYRPHDGPRFRRSREAAAWLRDLGSGRQIHVQEVAASGGRLINVYAHTEAAGFGPRHIVSAVFDRASFSAGARVLLADLRRRGWQL